MFDNYLVRRQVVLDYNLVILNSDHIGFSHDFGQKMALYLCMFLDKWTLKYCLMIIEVDTRPT